MPPKKAIALIPARGGSKRVPDKNIKELGGRPAITYTIQAALKSDEFDDVVVSTDSERIADIAREWGASVPFMRPVAAAGDTSPDIEWALHALGELDPAGTVYTIYSILRPTSPFRTPNTIRKAMTIFREASGIDSLRAVEKCSQHPAKMWIIKDNRMKPVLAGSNGNTPWHSSQYQALSEIYVQNASLEIAWTEMTLRTKTIAGTVIVPYITEGYEGFDINTEVDWELAERLLKRGEIDLSWWEKE